MLRSIFVTILFLAPSSQGALLFHLNLEENGILHFTGNNPPINAALIQELRQKAETQAKADCRQLLGNYTLLKQTGEEPITHSIQKYILPASFLCGREVNAVLEVVPYLVDSLEETSKSNDLARVARDQLSRIGKDAVVPLVDFIGNAESTPDAKRLAVESLGDILKNQNGAGLHSYILVSLIRHLNFNNDMLAYEARQAFGKYYGAAAFAKLHRNDFTDLGYAQAVAGISQNFKSGSSYEVEIGEFPALLSNGYTLVADFALSALHSRGFIPSEFDAIFPELRKLADPRGPKLSFVFNILTGKGATPSNDIAKVVANAVDLGLLEGNNASHGFLFQAMIALEKLVDFPSAKDARFALKAISLSNVNPTNDYLQRQAKVVLKKLGGE